MSSGSAWGRYQVRGPRGKGGAAEREAADMMTDSVQKRGRMFGRVDGGRGCESQWFNMVTRVGGRGRAYL